MYEQDKNGKMEFLVEKKSELGKGVLSSRLLRLVENHEEKGHEWTI